MGSSTSKTSGCCGGCFGGMTGREIRPDCSPPLRPQKVSNMKQAMQIRRPEEGTWTPSPNASGPFSPIHGWATPAPRQGRQVYLGVKKLLLNELGQQYLGVNSPIDAEHWGIGVGDEFYEVTGQDIMTKHMVIVGPNGVVASAPTADLTQFCNKSRIAEEYDDVIKLETEKGEPYLTMQSDDEIRKWTKEWVKRNPNYSVFCLQGVNCQNHSEEFCMWLTGNKVNRSNQFRSIVARAGGIIASGGSAKAGQLSASGLAMIGASQLAAQQAEQGMIRSFLQSVGLVAAPAAPTGVMVGAGAKAASGGLLAGVAIGAAGFASSLATERAAAAAGCKNEGQARARVSGRVAGSVGACATVGMFVGGPPGALGGAAVAGSVELVSNTIEYGYDEIRLWCGSSEVEFNGQIMVDQEEHKFDEDSAMYTSGVYCVQVSRPLSLRPDSAYWPYTFCVNIWKKVGVTFQTKDGVWHDPMHCQLPRMHTRRYSAANDECATVIKVQVTTLA